MTILRGRLGLLPALPSIQVCSELLRLIIAGEEPRVAGVILAVTVPEFRGGVFSLPVIEESFYISC